MKSYLIKQLAGTLLFFSLIFICAGRILYWQGIIYVSIGLIMSVLGFTVLKIDRELMNERSKPGEGTKDWDKMILGFSFLLTIAMYVVAGLDSGRYHFSNELSWPVIITGGLLTAAGQLIFLVAQKQNKFFSSTVRIQTDRQHGVCDTGLYKFVRHPAYMGSVIQAIGFPLIFTSIWSIIPVFLLVTLFLVRTSLEDKTLIDDLPGYQEYANNTRYRIVPAIW